MQKNLMFFFQSGTEESSLYCWTFNSFGKCRGMQRLDKTLIQGLTPSWPKPAAFVVEGSKGAYFQRLIYNFNVFLQLLSSQEYFGKFGKIHKIAINSSTNYAGPQVILLFLS